MDVFENTVLRAVRFYSRMGYKVHFRRFNVGSHKKCAQKGQKQISRGRSKKIMCDCDKLIDCNLNKVTLKHQRSSLACHKALTDVAKQQVQLESNILACSRPQKRRELKVIAIIGIVPPQWSLDAICTSTSESGWCCRGSVTKITAMG